MHSGNMAVAKMAAEVLIVRFTLFLMYCKCRMIVVFVYILLCVCANFYVLLLYLMFIDCIIDGSDIALVCRV